MAFTIPNLFAKSATGSQDAKPLPLIGHLPVNKQFQILGGALLGFLLIAIVAAYSNNRTVSHGTRYVAESSKLEMLSQRMAKAAERSLTGDYLGFEELAKSHEEVTKILEVLDKGDGGLPATSGSPRAALDTLMVDANKAVANAKAVEEGRPGLVTVGRAIVAIDEASQGLRERIQDLIDHGGKEKAVRLALLVERIAKDAAAMQGEVDIRQVSALGRDTIAAQQVLEGLTGAQADLVKDSFEGYRVSVEAVIGQAQNLLAAKRAGRSVFEDSGRFFDEAEKLTKSYQSAGAGRASGVTAVLAGLLVLVLVVLLAKVYLDDSRHRAFEAERTNRENQDAIMLLMDELGNLADGDLTVQATVSESITGAIADSVNFTTGELRKLVSGVNAASQQVTQATNEAGEVAKGLLAAANKQAAEIRDAGGAVEMITSSIKEVDESATQSAVAAQRTLEVTTQGAQAVQNTINGMNSIREQIQDTAKRIKRLGESSQEIGEIVDLISDITEQTNVLALNAAIQAASAGEAGRGFSVVAAEVQRLAERSAEATKQIGALVQTIQADTHDAVAAMEKSTQGVVEGARLSDAAGQSLREIEETTRNLANLVNSISVSTQVQTDMASEVANAMADILRITEQTTEGTQRTTASVAQLEGLANELQSSVSGFKL